MTSGALSKGDEARLVDLIRQSERVLRTGDASRAPSILQSLAPADDDPILAPALAKMITLGMSRMAAAGRDVRLEPFLAAMPQLKHNPTRMPELMAAETHIRRSHAEAVDQDEYRVRFPEHFDGYCKLVRSGSDTLAAADSSDSTDAPAEPPLVVRPQNEPDAAPPRSVAPESPPIESAASSVSTSDANKRTFVPDFSSYHLVRSIGKGQFGEVWQAVAPGGVDVAVKVVPWPKAHRLSQMELRALEAVKRVRHPFLIQMHAYWAMQDQVVIVMELCEESLEQRAEECRAAGAEGIPAEELTRYTRQAAEALDHLHRVSVVHRDIKPANILLATGHAKLGDFGVARLFEREVPNMRSTLVGTPHFMAPEVWDAAVCPASDQFSLAATYLDLRVGLPKASLGELMSGNTGVEEVLAKLPKRERVVLAKALDRNPKKRFESCRAMAESLEASVAPEVVMPGGEQSTSRRKWWVAAAVVFLAIVVGAIGLSGQVENLLRLVLGSEPELPIGFADVFEAAGGAHTVNIGGSRFYDRVFLKQVVGEGRLPDDVRLEFVLVPMTRSLGDPQPFYISVDKVTNIAFAAFAEQNPGILDNAWQSYETVGGRIAAQEHPQLPVMNVTVDEAHAFARWVHSTGRLPSVKEWQKAAGFCDCRDMQGEPIAESSVDCGTHPEGPYVGTWQEDRLGEVAVGRDLPQAVGTASADLSQFGCRDMSGNGYELTSDVVHDGSDTKVPVANPLFLRTYVKLCGQSYEKPNPLKYEDLLGRPMHFYYMDPDFDSATPGNAPLNREFDVGFRVVIPIPTQASVM